MNEQEPDNSELDALYRRAGRPELRPALFAAMLETDLYTVVPRGNSTRPADMVARPQGKNLEFIRWASGGEEYFFVFTSLRMALLGRRKIKSKVPLLIIALPGPELLRKMHRQGVGMALNPWADEYELLCNDKVVEGILDGSLLHSEDAPEEERVSGMVLALKPEDYPTSLVQPVFELLKTRPEVQAGWVLHPVEEKKRGEKYYLFGLLTTAEDTRALEHAVLTVLGMVDFDHQEGARFSVTIMDYGNPGHAGLMREFVPFYAAPGYQAPSAAGPARGPARG